MDDPQRCEYLEAKSTLAHLQSAQTDLQARTATNGTSRYLAVGVNAAERHANAATA